MTSDLALAQSPMPMWSFSTTLPIKGRDMTTEIKRPCVLIVEDYRLVRAMFRVTLECAGFEVVEAADGVEALLCVRATVPDLILMDLSMPLMDGWEVTRHLKSDGRTAGIPIVVLSALTRDDVAERTKRAGCVALLTKPCLPSDLVKEVRHCLSLTWSRLGRAPDDERQTRPAPRTGAASVNRGRYCGTAAERLRPRARAAQGQGVPSRLTLS
jgi:two-component system cell cycle response regulator DivK